MTMTDDAGRGAIPTPSVLDRCRSLPLRTFAAGETILAEGTRSGVLYILASGVIEVVKGDVQINTASEPGAFFGEVSTLLDVPHTATVRALEACTFHVAEDPLAFLRSNPEIALELSRLLARRLHFVTTYLVDVKRQFEGSGDHLAIVDEVLESLSHHQEAEASPGSDRCPDPTVE
jgi:CRP/FNR family cyclic AMP-dependent transcriptional regulator